MATKNASASGASAATASRALTGIWVVMAVSSWGLTSSSHALDDNHLVSLQLLDHHGFDHVAQVGEIRHACSARIILDGANRLGDRQRIEADLIDCPGHEVEGVIGRVAH